MGRKSLEELKIAAGDVSLSLGAETSDKIETKAFQKLDKYQKYVAAGVLQGVASAGVVTLTILQATAAAGTNSKTLSTTVTDTATSTNATDLLIVTCECDASELDTGSSFYWAGARLALTTGADSNEGAGLISLCTDGRFDPQSN